MRLDPVEVTAADLAPAAAGAHRALSARPARVRGTRWKLPRWRIAELLSLPVAGATDVAIAGPGAEAWFAKLRKTVERPPADATFRPVGDGTIEVVPAKDGLAVDVPATAKALLAAAVSPGERTRDAGRPTAQAERTTAEAQAMGIERRLASYTTLYAGTSDRITNLQLGVLLDGALVAPGATFSFNDRVGERTVERGFRPAP